MNQIHLYDYQLDMKRRIEAAFEKHQSVMVQMPTGTGKTYLLTACVCDWLERCGGEVWIVAHRRELVEQIRHTIDKGLTLIGEQQTAQYRTQLSVVSIQWLARHYREIQTAPGLIVIDEAHHALAKTYAEVMMTFPQAKKLGVTATPCRLSKHGFVDLFEVMLASRPISDFIREGYLSDFDYVSLNPTSEDQRKINGLEKRAADGDYSTAEMQRVLDTKPSISRLYESVSAFANGKKGIVYAINIAHAEHIAAYYRAHGMRAIAISSKTPAAERACIVERFRRTSAAHDGASQKAQENRLGREEDLDVLVNVDLFGEGFDCPDVEFVQMARPTLSLAKYLQMVGRGLRKARGKAYCTILDNVGLYRLFGLPSEERDWESMFLGTQQGMGRADAARDWALRLSSYSEPSQRRKRPTVRTPEMVVIMKHDTPRIAEQVAILLTEFGKTQNFKYEKHGLLGEHTYVRTGESPRVYHLLEEQRLGWQLMYDLQASNRRYYALNVADGRMQYVGRVTVWNERDERAAESAYVVKQVSAHEYAVCTSAGKVMLKGLARAIVADDNLAQVAFHGESRSVWLNLYTLQEFDVRPIIVHRSGQDYLRVADRLYAYKNKALAGIPISGQALLYHANALDHAERILPEGVAKLRSRKRIDRELPWIDLINGIRFAKQPWVERHGFLEFSTIDGRRLYPRVSTDRMDDESFVLPEALAHGVDGGLRFRNFYIPQSDEPRLYEIKDKMDDSSLFEDENHAYYVKRGLSPVLTATTLEDWKNEKNRWTQMVDDFERRAEERQRRGLYKHPLPARVNEGYRLTDYHEPSGVRIVRSGDALVASVLDRAWGKWTRMGNYEYVSKQAYGIRVVKRRGGKYLLRTQYFVPFSADDDPSYDFAELLDEAYLHLVEGGREYYVDLESRMCFRKIPELVRIGPVVFQKDGDMYFPLSCSLNTNRAFRRGEIVGGEDICFIGKDVVVVKGCDSAFDILRRYTDGRRYVVSRGDESSATQYELYYDGVNPVELKARKVRLCQ